MPGTCLLWNVVILLMTADQLIHSPLLNCCDIYKVLLCGYFAMLLSNKTIAIIVLVFVLCLY